MPTGVDAICIALFDPEKRIVDRVASATGLLTPFDPQVLKGESYDSLPYLAEKVAHLRIVEMRDSVLRFAYALGDMRSMQGSSMGGWAQLERLPSSSQQS